MLKVFVVAPETGVVGNPSVTIITQVFSCKYSGLALIMLIALNNALLKLVEPPGPLKGS